MDRTDQRGPLHSEVHAKQGGAPSLTIWVLMGSLALAIIVGVMLFTGADEVAPSRPTAIENPANPPANSGSGPAQPGSAPAQPGLAPTQPNTNQ